MTHDKLVRDRIPEIIKANGHQAVTRVLDGEEYHAALLAKLVEEAREAQNATDDELPGELADIWEVLQALLSTLHLNRPGFGGDFLSWKDDLLCRSSTRGN